MVETTRVSYEDVLATTVINKVRLWMTANLKLNTGKESKESLSGSGNRSKAGGSRGKTILRQD